MPGSISIRTVNPSSSSMPPATQTLSIPKPWRAAISVRNSKDSGSPYHDTCAIASRIASAARGDTPNALSLAPTRTANRAPRRRSIASGPTKGIVAGNPATMGVKRIRAGHEDDHPRGEAGAL